MLIETRKCHYEWFNDQICSSKPLGGFDLFQHKNPKDGPFYLWSFGIYEVHDRMNGYGQKMLKEALTLANGHPVILYVHKKNPVAIHVYEKAGFRIVGEYMGKEAWTMQHDGLITDEFNSNKEMAVC